MNIKSFTNPLKPIINTITRFNLVIFILIVVGGLIISILILNDILRLPYDTSNYKSSNSGTVKITFDETTILRLEKLKKSSDNSTNQPLPPGRINPFSE